MRLLGFNMGRIAEQVIDGERVRTGYVKSPAAEPWLITASGAAGDEVAVHADHLYAFDRAGYDFWSAELGVARTDWTDGHFAENLTVDSIDQSALRVGDILRVGSAVLVVTGPRVPCWKLTWRLGQPKSFMRRFRLSGRSGVYLGVLEPGAVAPGDPFVLERRDPSAPTVAELSVLCDSGTRVSPAARAVVDRALASPHLSPTVRSTLALKVANLERAGETDERSWRGWRRFEVDDIIAEAGDAISVELRPADSAPLPRFEAGQHVVVRLTPPGSSPIVRTWSLSRWDREPQGLRITVKVRPDGAGATALARARSDGLLVELRTPAGRFRLDRGSFRPVVLVAAGIGITPMMAMMRAHLDRAVHTPPLWILHGTRDPASTTFRAELDALAARHEHVHVHYFHSRVADVSAADPHGPRTHPGRLSAERVIELLRANYLPTPEGSAPIPWFESDVYVCGPAGFTAAVCDGLVAAGANPEHVLSEDFTAASGGPAAPRRHDDARVVFEPSGLEATWRADAERTLLELAEDSGLSLPFDCRTGSCRTCEARVLSGHVDGPVRTGADGDERALLCSSFPLSERVRIEAPEE